MSLQYSDLADFNDFDDYEISESITMYNGMTITEGNDLDRTEFFSLGMFDVVND